MKKTRDEESEVTANTTEFYLHAHIIRDNQNCLIMFLAGN